jgi:hypothetical protein
VTVETIHCGTVDVDACPAFRGSWQAVAVHVPILLQLGLSVDLSMDADGQVTVRSRESGVA